MVLQDSYEKPAAAVLHRQPHEGGLGLFSVENRALALLLRNFCELSCNPQFTHSLYLKTLFRTNVLGEYCSGQVRPSPYYNKEFFSILRHYHNNSPLNIATMKVKDWYKVLVEDRITMIPATPYTAARLSPIRTELLCPDTLWTRTWHLARQKGLPPDLSSHLFRSLHGILPTQDRVARLGLSRNLTLSGECRLCTGGHRESLPHAYFACDNNCMAAESLVAALQPLCPGITCEQILTLNYNIAIELELAAIFVLSVGLKFIWDCRADNKYVQTYQLNAEIFARIENLGQSKFKRVAALLKQKLNI